MGTLEPLTTYFALLKSWHRSWGVFFFMTLACLAGVQDSFASSNTEVQYQFNIPPQPLEGALAQLGSQAKFQIIFDSGWVENRKSQGLNGQYTRQTALNKLLDGTGLDYRLTERNSAILKPAKVREKKSALNDDRMRLDLEMEEDPILLTQNKIEKNAEKKNQEKDIRLKEVQVTAEREKILHMPNPHVELGNLPQEYSGGQVAVGSKVGIFGNRNFMDTPFNQTAFTSKLMQDQQGRTLNDVLNNDPSVRRQFSAGSGIDQFNLRGFLLSNQDTSFGGLYGVAPGAGNVMAVESLERVEVIKGPSALLFGAAPAGSVAGRINLVPKRAKDESITQVNLQYVSDSQFGGHIDIGRRFGEKKRFGVRFNGVYRDGDLAIDQQSQEFAVATLGIDYRGERFRVDFDLGYQYQDLDSARRSIGLASGLTAVPTSPDSSTNWSQPWSFAEVEHKYGAMRGEFDLTENWTVNVGLGGSIRYNNSRSDNGTVQDVLGTLTSQFFPGSSYDDYSSAQAGLRGTFNTGFVHHNFVVSGSKYWQESGSISTNRPTVSNLSIYNPVFVPEIDFGLILSPENAPRQREIELSSLSLADTLSVLDERVQLTAGFIRQQVETVNFDRTTQNVLSSYNEYTLSPGVALVVRPWDFVSFYANFIQGLTQGNTAPDNAANAGEIFAPTKTEQYEAGLKFDFGNMGATLSFFQISQPNAFTDPVTNIFTEDGEQRNQGMEIQIFGEMVRGVRVLGGLSLIDAELTQTQGGVNEGNEAPGVPSVQLNLGGEWDTPFLQGFTVRTLVAYTSSNYYDAANTLEIPSWTRLDLGARYATRAFDVPITIRANVENVADADYWSAVQGDRRIGLSAPRTFLLSSSFNF